MTEKTKSRIGIILLIVFLGMLVFGATTPEVNIVFKKATNICLECIGIGG